MWRLAEPGWLALIGLTMIPWFWVRWRPGIAWPTLSSFEGRSRWPVRLLGSIPRLARFLAMVGLAVAMARPQVPNGQVRVAGRGVSIVALIDRSPSMSARDFPSEGKPISRLEAAKQTLGRFIEGRNDDLVGIVPFASQADVLAAPTPDQGFLLEAVRSIRPAGASEVGTSLGDAIVEGLGALRGLPTRRNVLILLTDGRDEPATPRPVAPVEAAEMARDLGVTLHAIAIGQAVPATQPGQAGSDGPDLATLRKLAAIGGGQMFEAADLGSLGQVFERIDALEKSPVVGTIRTVYRERYAPWVAASLALLAVDLLMTRGRFRRLP